jgi:GNAT superfamily N-acetyltransferase
MIIRQARIEDANIIKSLAEAVWWPTYEPLLGKKQVSYMLNLFYKLEKLTQQIADNEQTYILLLNEKIPIGFASYSPRTENPDVYKLHKIYCLTETKGKGYGKLLLNAVEQAILQTGKHILELNVNRYNPAIGFYEKMGYKSIYTEDIDIGNGYWMNDYVMRKELEP